MAIDPSEKNITRIKGVMDWIESETSQLLWINGHNVLRRSVFTMSIATPLLVLGESVYETTLVLRHFCGDDLASGPQDHRILVQALLYQVLQQNPKVFEGKKSALTREATHTLITLWDLLLDCLAEVNADCTIIIIENIDVLKEGPSSIVDEGKFILHQLHALVQDSTKLIKILLIASLARDQASSSQGRSALMLTQHREPMDILQDELPLVTHKLIEIQQKTCKSIRFAEITMLYVPSTTVYTFEDDELRAFVIVELSGMELRNFESYNPLQMRVWSIDHDGQNVVRRYHDLTVRQFSGQRDIKDLQYIPAGYLPNESEQRRSLIARGKLWWTYSFGTHHVTTDRYKTQAIIDQRSLVGNKDLSESRPVCEALLAKDSDSLKPLYRLLCPPLIDSFILQEQKQTTVKVCNIRLHQYNTRALDEIVLADDRIVPLLKAVCESRMMGGASKVDEQSTGDLARKKEDALVILLNGRSGVGKSFASECAAESAKRPLLPVSIADMSDDAKGFEQALRDSFTLAETWNAIVVLQEADIHLSTDKKTTAFLRALDQYHGILILQANHELIFKFKKNILNESLQACIHLFIRLSALPEAQRIKLAYQILRVLERDYENLLVENYLLQTFEPILRKVAWNAKEIRNTLQMAVAFAEKEASDKSSSMIEGSVYSEREKTPLKRRHLEEAITLSRNYECRRRSEGSDQEAETSSESE